MSDQELRFQPLNRVGKYEGGPGIELTFDKDSATARVSKDDPLYPEFRAMLNDWMEQADERIK